MHSHRQRCLPNRCTLLHFCSFPARAEQGHAVVCRCGDSNVTMRSQPHGDVLCCVLAAAAAASWCERGGHGPHPPPPPGVPASPGRPGCSSRAQGAGGRAGAAPSPEQLSRAAVGPGLGLGPGEQPGWAGQGEPGSTRVWAGGRRPAGRGEGLRLLQGQVLGKQGLGVVAQGQKPALSPCGALAAPQPRATRPHPRARLEPLGLFQIQAGIALALWASFELNLGTFVPFGVVSA